MATFTWTAVFLGNFADIDSDESDFDTESPGSLLGTHGSSADPLKDKLVSVTADDADSDTNLNRDNSGSAETMTVDGVPKQLDSGIVVDATITYIDGTTANVTAVLGQTTDGDVYLLPEISANADTAAYEAKAIESLTVNAVTVSSTNIAANRIQTDFICFTAGTLIKTDLGEIPVERLAVGDMVVTLDHGLQPIRWIARRTVTSIGNAAPVRIRRGALGHGLPSRDLLVSQQHRMLVRSKIVRRIFDCDEVLVAAKKLLGVPGIEIAEDRQVVTYVHFMCDRHEIVFAEDAHSESFYPGPTAVATLRSGQRDQLFRLFPSLKIGLTPLSPVRPFAKGKPTGTLIARHMKNRKSLIASIA